MLPAGTIFRTPYYLALEPVDPNKVEDSFGKKTKHYVDRPYVENLLVLGASRCGDDHVARIKRQMRVLARAYKRLKKQLPESQRSRDASSR